MEGKRGPLAIIACKSGLPFTKKIVDELNKYLREEKRDTTKIINSKEIRFANSEIKTVINESIRGSDVYVIQDVENSTNRYSVDENLRALKTATNAANNSDAHYITAILPVLPYARQDKQIGRECLTSALVAQEIEIAGASRVITLDVHNTGIAGAFRSAHLENLHASRNIIDYINQKGDLENLVVVAPDHGGINRAIHYAQELKTELALIFKKRNYNELTNIENITLLGDIKEKNVLVVDDMISTGGTLYAISKMLKEKGAKDIHLACSLPLFNPPALDKFDELFNQGKIKEIIGTDAVYHGEDFQEKHPWFKEVSVAKYFAKVIYNINNHKSLSKLLE